MLLINIRVLSRISLLLETDAQCENCDDTYS